MSRSSKAMGISGDAIHSYGFNGIEDTTAILKGISDKGALDILFQVYFNIISIGKDKKAANILASIYDSLGYESDELERLIIKGQKAGVFLTKRTPDIAFLNKIAISMGKINKVLNEEIEINIKTSADALMNSETLIIYAYVCRISILDRIDEHRGHIFDNSPIVIPLGLIKTRKETMESALNLTVQRLSNIAHLNTEVGHEVDLILNREGKFDEIDNIIPEEQKKQLMS